MNEEVIIAVTLISEVHRVREYRVRYMGLEYTVGVVTTASGSTFNYEGEEYERIPEQVLDFMEDWLLDKF